MVGFALQAFIDKANVVIVFLIKQKEFAKF
jgi:hypothetical protein